MGKCKYDVSAKAICPFYRSEQRTEHDAKIRCDGIIPGTWLHLCFERRDGMTAWRDQHCKCDWEQCAVAQALEKAI